RRRHTRWPRDWSSDVCSSDLRSELLLAGRAADTVTEDAQFEVYRQLLKEMQPAPVTIRTFDIDEDQLATGEQPRRGLWSNTSDEIGRASWKGKRVGRGGGGRV